MGCKDFSGKYSPLFLTLAISSVQAILRGEGEDPSGYKFMAIGLWKAERQMFEIDFHDVERRVLKNKVTPHSGVF